MFPAFHLVGCTYLGVPSPYLSSTYKVPSFHPLATCPTFLPISSLLRSVECPLIAFCIVGHPLREHHWFTYGLLRCVYPPRTPVLCRGADLFVRLMSCANSFPPISEIPRLPTINHSGGIICLPSVLNDGGSFLRHLKCLDWPSPHSNTTFTFEKGSLESHISHISGLKAASVCHHLVCCGVSVYPPRTHPGLTLGGTLFVRLMSCAKPFLPISERQSLRYNTTIQTISC